MKQLHELAQEYATILRKISVLESTSRTRVVINIAGLENWGNAASEVREMMEPHLPGAVAVILQKAREEAALLKQQLDLASKETAGLKIVK